MKTAFAIPIALSLVSTVAFAARGPSIDVAPVACVSLQDNPKIVATIGGSTISSARVYFHAEGQTAEYFVEMRAAASGRYVALLPKVEYGTKAIVYRIRASRRGEQPVESAPQRIAVAQTCGIAVLTPAEARTASNIVLGMPAASTAALPLGFRCSGVVSQITAAGVLQPYWDCMAINRSVDGGVTASAGAKVNYASSSAAAGSAFPNDSPATLQGPVKTDPNIHRTARRRAALPPPPRIEEPVSPARP